MHNVGRRDICTIICSDKIDGVTEGCFNLIVREVRQLYRLIDDFPRHRLQRFERHGTAVWDTSIESEKFSELILEYVYPRSVEMLEVLVYQEASGRKMRIEVFGNLTREVLTLHCIHEQDLDRAAGPFVHG